MPTPRMRETQVAIGCSSYDIARIASSAERMRAALNLSPQEAVPIFDILEFRIADVEHFKDFRFVVDLDTNFDHSVLAMTRLNPPEIIVRESVYRHAAVGSESARVVLAHELGHLWLGHGRNISTEVQLPTEEHPLLVEWQADEFAAELLMPGKIVVNMPPDCIAKQFSVPVRTATVRLQTLAARRKSSSEPGVPKFERYTGLLSRFETEVLKWVPMSRRAGDYGKYAELFPVSSNQA